MIEIVQEFQVEKELDQQHPIVFKVMNGLPLDTYDKLTLKSNPRAICKRVVFRQGQFFSEVKIEVDGIPDGRYNVLIDGISGRRVYTGVCDFNNQEGLVVLELPVGETVIGIVSDGMSEPSGAYFVGVTR